MCHCLYAGAIAEHVPYVRHAYGLCNEVVRLFGASVTINSNCAEVVARARHLQVRFIMALYIIQCCMIVLHKQ
jgi:hypothetical protein